MLVTLPVSGFNVVTVQRITLAVSYALGLGQLAMSSHWPLTIKTWVFKWRQSWKPKLHG